MSEQPSPYTGHPAEVEEECKPIIWEPDDTDRVAISCADGQHYAVVGVGPKGEAYLLPVFWSEYAPNWLDAEGNPLASFDDVDDGSLLIGEQDKLPYMVVHKEGGSVHMVRLVVAQSRSEYLIEKAENES